MIELKRDDSQYLAVEKFEDYELTYCMAYEMAIRNDEVIKTIYSFYNNYINDDIYNCYILSTDNFKKCTEDSNKLMEFLLSPLELYLDYHLFKNINDDIKAFNDYYSEYENEYPRDRLKHILFTPFTKPTNFKEYIPNEKLVEEKITKRYRSFISHLINDDKKSFTIHHNSITPRYSRPLSPWFNEIKERNLVLNLALPTKELVDFVKKVKLDYEHDHSFFGTLKELEGNTLERADSRNSRLSNQEKLADMLYIYDCLKLGYSQRKIQYKLYNYYADKGKETKTFSSETINNYNKIATDYIDNQQYKTLVTGLRNN